MLNMTEFLKTSVCSANVLSLFPLSQFNQKNCYWVMVLIQFRSFQTGLNGMQSSVLLKRKADCNFYMKKSSRVASYLRSEELLPFSSHKICWQLFCWRRNWCRVGQDLLLRSWPGLIVRTPGSNAYESSFASNSVNANAYVQVNMFEYARWWLFSFHILFDRCCLN